MVKYLNTDKLPSEVADYPWLYESKNGVIKTKQTNLGKWMLFYSREMMDSSWILAKQLYHADKLEGVAFLKCSTSYDNPGAVSKEQGVINLYCSINSHDDEKIIMRIGERILEMFDYKDQQSIYFKPESTPAVANGEKGIYTRKHTYKLSNPRFQKTKVSLLRP